MHFHRAGRLDVEHARHAHIDLGDVDGARGFQRHVVALIAQPLEQADAALLRQRLAAGDTDVAGAVAGDFGEDVVDLPPLSAVEGIRGVAVLAAQRTAGQAHEHGGPADAAGFALQGQEDLGDPQPIGRRGCRIEGDGVHAGILADCPDGPGLNAGGRAGSR
jgi:hypothetical protein